MGGWMCKTRDIWGLHKGGTVSRLDQETILTGDGKVVITLTH
jgi:hypothetical protein